MKISKDLIERYHQGLCSPDERKAVEQWLLEDDDTSLFPDELLDKNSTGEEIWDRLRRDTIEAAAADKKPLSAKRYLSIYGSAAAVVLLLMAALSLWKQKDISQTPRFAPSEKMAGLNTDLFDIEFGHESQATFDSKNELVDFCGMIKITPKKSMKLSFANVCGNHDEMKREVDIIEGTTYFALDLKNDQYNELLVMNEDLLFELPPLVRNSLISQFGI